MPNFITDSKNTTPAMSAQQSRFSASSRSRLAAYRELVVGEKNYGYLAAFELYNLLFANTAGLLGYAMRGLLLPQFLKSAGNGLAIGRGLTIRHPHRISLGKRTIVDDFAVLDIRSDNSTTQGIGEIEIGEHVLIGRSTLIVAKNAKVTLGSACNVSSFCRLASQSQITIGESTLIAAYAYIGPGNHIASDPERPIIEQEMDIKGGVTIGRNCWIGTRATILDGVTIGDNAVIGAHSLVREDVPANTVVAGTPAKLIRSRS